jgi:hypothetical protein
MKAVEHTVAAEELMAYLDGEVAEERRVAVHAHVLQCEPCGRLLSELRQASRDAALWQVGPVPENLRPPAVAREAPARASLDWRAGLMPRAVAFQAAAVGVVVLAAVSGLMLVRPSGPTDPILRTESSSRGMPVPPKPAVVGGAAGVRLSEPALSYPQGTALEQVSRSTAQTALQWQPQIVRTASMMVLTTDFASARPAAERVARELGGFVARIDVSDGADKPRSLRATLRVPADRLDEALASLRLLGTVSNESQGGDDVTAQVRDLAARLANARSTEKRLQDILLKRTGEVGDVLQVEREIARVRGEIEQMAAEQADLASRVAQATIALHVEEERKATLGLGPLPVQARMRNALVDGMRTAKASLVAVSLSLLHAGPVVVLWVGLLWWPGRALVRAGRRLLA